GPGSAIRRSRVTALTPTARQHEPDGRQRKIQGDPSPPFFANNSGCACPPRVGRAARQPQRRQAWTAYRRDAGAARRSSPGRAEGQGARRGRAACEGALLVVDASQGVEAQTLANVYQAIEANLEIVPVLNKFDLPAAEPERVRQQIEDVIGLDASHAIPISAKTGIGIED